MLLLTAIVLLLVLILVGAAIVLNRNKSLEQRAQEAEALQYKTGRLIAGLYAEALKILGDNPGDPVAMYVQSAVESGLTSTERGKLNVR